MKRISSKNEARSSPHNSVKDYNSRKQRTNYNSARSKFTCSWLSSRSVYVAGPTNSSADERTLLLTARMGRFFIYFFFFWWGDKGLGGCRR